MHLSLLLAAVCASLVSATVSRNVKSLRPPAINVPEISFNGSGFFDQLLDHDNPALGTFKQKYWWNSQYYKGPGAPVVLFTPGEAAAARYTGYLTNLTVTGLYAEAIEGAVILLEHRFWGDSSPYAELTVKNLQQLTLKNSIADLAHFAKTANLPFDPTGSSKAAVAPWVLSGGSYSGALAAWTESTAPGTFWAYHASSAPVQAVYDMWTYFKPIQEGMAKNCSADVTRVIDYIDSVLVHGSEAKKTALKAKFGLEGVKHDADFAGALENGPWLWQSNSFTTGYSGFFQFCDYIEGVYSNTTKNPTYPTHPSPAGVGLEVALEGYAAWTKDVLVPGYCANFGYWSDPLELACFDTYNASSPLFTDLTVDNTIDRQWNWFLCNEPFAYWQDGAPTDRPTIVSRLVDGAYWQRQCDLFFPAEGKYTYGSKTGKTVDDVNRYTKGWHNTDSTRLIWTNGEFDPWRSTSTSSEFRPGGPLQPTKKAPLQIIPGGFHCSDLRVSNGMANAGVMNVIDNEVAQIKSWVAEYYSHSKKVVKRTPQVPVANLLN